MAYFTLLQRHEGQWGIEFGDKDKATVESERDDYRDHFIKAKDLKIVTTRTSRNAEIVAVATKLSEATK